MEKLEDHVGKSRTMANAESPHFENMMDSVAPPTLQLKSEIKKEEVESESVNDIVTEPYQFALAPPSFPDPGGDDEGNTGLPAQLKAGVESLSGFSLDDVNVHYNSEKPAQLQAKAYAQGTDIHLGSGQEQHLPHEAWHVVQQKQGRVQATTQMKGAGVNDDVSLESEADIMGAKAMQLKPFRLGEDNDRAKHSSDGVSTSKQAMQLKLDEGVDLSEAPLAEIKVAFEAYNALEDDNEEGRIRLLDVLDRKIYAYFTAHPNKKTSAVVHGQKLKSLLNKTKQEHADLVDATKGDDTFLPINTAGMDDGEKAEILTLWNSIKNSAGGIKVAGEDEFKKSTRAELAKLLNTSTGRKLLKYLNTEEVGPDAKDKSVSIAKDLGDIDANFSTYEVDHGRDGGSSYALPRSALTSDEGKPDGTEVFGDTGDLVPGEALDDLTPVNLIASILKGDSGVKMGDQKLNFSEGDASVVKVVERDIEVDGEYTMGGMADNEVITPSFVTLGHELGHAFKIKAGALAQGAFNESEIFAQIEGNVDERGLWTNAEEKLNILGFENEIRKDAGIHERKYHKPLETVEARRNRSIVKALETQVMNIDYYMTQTQTYQTASGYLAANMANIADPVIYQQAQDNYAAIQANPPTAEILALKVAQIDRAKDYIHGIADNEYDFLPQIPGATALLLWIGVNQQVLLDDTTGRITQELIQGSLYDFKQGLDEGAIARDLVAFRRQQRRDNRKGKWDNFKGKFGF